MPDWWGLNVETRRPDTPIDLQVPGTDLTTTDERAYVVSRGAGAVASVDLINRRVVAQSVLRTHAIAAADEVWVLTGSELIALDAQRLEETARLPIDGAAVAAEGDRVFVSGTQPMLTEVDARSHRVSRVITDTNSECGDVHIAFNSIWLSDNVGDVVRRVPLMNR